MTDADYADNVVLLVNKTVQAEFLLVQTARGIGIYVNASYAKYLCFKQETATAILSSKPLKLLDLFTYLRSSISSTESDINILIGKAFTATDMSIRCKSYLYFIRRYT